jgi:hypothetical protein
VETTLGRRECKRRADILHFDIDVSRRKWEPAFFDPETAMEIPGPAKYVLEIGVPVCETHETLFAVFHHQVKASLHVRFWKPISHNATAFVLNTVTFPFHKKALSNANSETKDI